MRIRTTHAALRLGRLTLLLALAALALAALAPLAAAGPLAALAIQQAELTAGGGAGGDYFGWSVALSGDTALVAAACKDSRAGAAFVFRRSGTTWTQEATLTAPAGVAYDYFGGSLALSGDTALVGAYGKNSNTGAAYVFTRSGTTWTQEATLTAPAGVAHDYFGYAVALDGDTALVGADGENSYRGAAYVFTRSGATWSEQAELTATGGVAYSSFGAAVALDGDTALVGASNRDSATGAAYVFTRSGVTWSQQAEITASDGAEYDWFGTAVALDGDTALVGANGKDGYAGVDAGAAYVFTRSGTVWSRQAELTASDPAADDNFGISVALSGDSALVGAAWRDRATGAAYAFTRGGTTWSRAADLTAGDGMAGDYFGQSVAIEPGTALVGADGKNGGAGATYVFVDGAHVWPSVVGGAAGHGTISPDTTQTLALGSTPTFSFTPDQGYEAKDVLVDGSPVTMTTPTSYTFPALSASHTISVEFALQTFAITPSVVGGAAGHGTISPDATQTVGYGDTPTFAFTPDDGYRVKEVKVDGSVVTMTGTDDYSFPAVDAGHEISVAFTAIVFKGAPVVAGGAPVVTTGTKQTLTWETDTPVVSGSFDIVAVDTASRETTIVAGVPADGSARYSADWTVLQQPGSVRTLYVACAPGVRSPASTAVRVASPALTVTAPATGSTWSRGATQTVSWSVTPALAVGSFRVWATPAGGGTTKALSATVVPVVPGQTTYDLTCAWALPAGAWNLSVYYYVSGTTFTAQNVVRPQVTVPAFFTITASASLGGTISPAGAVAVDSGRSATFTMTPAAGYHVQDVVVDGASAGSLSAYTFTNVTAGHSIAAAFEKNPTITVTAPVTGSTWSSGTTQTVVWSLARPVSVGSFRVWATPAGSGTTRAVSATVVPASAGRATYSLDCKWTLPADDWKLSVFYYASGTTFTCQNAVKPVVHVP